MTVSYGCRDTDKMEHNIASSLLQAVASCCPDLHPGVAAVFKLCIELAAASQLTGGLDLVLAFVYISLLFWPEMPQRLGLQQKLQKNNVGHSPQFIAPDHQAVCNAAMAGSSCEEAACRAVQDFQMFDVDEMFQDSSGGRDLALTHIKPHFGKSEQDAT